MGERLRRGLKPRNKRETGVGPLKGKNPGERPELSKTRGRREDHQEARQHLQGAKRNLRQRFEAHPEGYRTKPERQPVDGSKGNVGGHRTGPSAREEQWREPRPPEDSLPRRLLASARTTRKRASSNRARREVSDRGSKPTQQGKGLSTTDNPRMRTSVNQPTHWTCMVTRSRRAVATRRHSPKGREEHTKPSFRSRIKPASTPQG